MFSLFSLNSFSTPCIKFYYTFSLFKVKQFARKLSQIEQDTINLWMFLDFFSNGKRGEKLSDCRGGLDSVRVEVCVCLCLSVPFSAFNLLFDIRSIKLKLNFFLFDEQQSR